MSIKGFALVAAAVMLIGMSAHTADAACGDFNGDGTVSAQDALGVLRTAVGATSCPLARCDVNSSGSISAPDALGVLQSAVGQNVVLACPGVAVSSIGDLPRATAPVQDDGGSAGASLVVGSLTGGDPAMVLGTLSPSTFTPDSSMAACEVANMTRTAIDSAAQGDLILCYVQNVFESLENPTVDIYDGQYHTFALDFGTPPPGADPEDFGGPSLVRIRIQRDGSTITDFEMFACGDSVEGNVQSEYVHQSIDGTDFAMVAKGLYGDSQGTGGHHVTVTGTLDDSGSFVGTKAISTSHTNQWTDGSGYGSLLVAQRSSTIDLDGYEAGTWSFEGQAQSYGNRMTAGAELLDQNVAGEAYDIGKLALGDGAAKVNMTNANDVDTWEFTQVEGWNGVTTLVDMEGPAAFVDQVTAAELVAVGDPVTIEFGPGEAYACDDEPEALLPVDQMLLDQECSKLSLGHDWLNCYEIIGDGPGGGPQCDPADPACDGFCPPDAPEDPDCGQGPQCDPADPACDGFCPPDAPEDPDCDGPLCGPGDPGCTCTEPGVCGGQASGGCFCDVECVQSGDCCPDACDVCGQCP